LNHLTEILLASNNLHKVFEFQKIFSDKFKIITPNEAKIHFEVEETGTSFEENAKIKSEHLFKLTNKPSIADDSGLVVEALNGEPGVYSARFGKKEFNDKDRALYLLEKMLNQKNRKAYYQVVIAFTNVSGTKFFSGDVHGIIMNDYDEIGKNGFGYDPVFFHEGLNKRFSECTIEEKNSVSHRSIAVQKFLDYSLKTSI
jgi:XTP/dITP diphosphohydrolase